MTPFFYYYFGSLRFIQILFFIIIRIIIIFITCSTRKKFTVILSYLFQENLKVFVQQLNSDYRVTQLQSENFE